MLIREPDMLTREQVQNRLEQVGYIAGPQLAMAISMMQQLERPLLLEGDAGVGKTQVAISLAEALGRRLILKPPGGEGSDAETAQRVVGPSADHFEGLLGREGVVVTALRPSGSADFEGRRVSVVSDGEAIPDGTRVRVINIEGNRVVVEALQT